MNLVKAAVILVFGATISLPSLVGGQTRSGHDSAAVYGARLNAKGQPAALNRNRVNNRINDRIGNRLSLRIERYRPDINPTAAFRAIQDDKTRINPVIAQPPQDNRE
ncbi:hypothetical protein [Sphingomonas lycopersici]|uniref:Uncharacterized protein n=1 Tax=Sphingomonas lycopersici TaxID=2951807 RepID=A0AA42CS19_9SPHN|nr:hypothetical protein [Sphingomonas lycopersici]MCW6537290.1 hypothetical protein [Sphingomonas lycopersici]